MDEAKRLAIHYVFGSVMFEPADDRRIQGVPASAGPSDVFCGFVLSLLLCM